MKENLEIGKDYVSEVNGVIVIDRIGVSGNRGFFEGFFVCNLVCSSPDEWREATESEVVEAFKKDLIHRYGKDWETMKIKERHPDSSLDINNGSWDVEILKYIEGGWAVYNKNGLLYYNGIWVERLEEEGEEENVEKLEVGKDYVNLHDNDVVVIDRVSDTLNKGFERLVYKNYMSCWNTSNWREATEQEVIEAFKKHLVHRYGEDWKTMKIKERHPSLSSSSIVINNDGSWFVDISKFTDGWSVWNRHGLLYRNGIWVERLEEEPKIHIKEAIEEKTVIHCKTIGEADRILKMAHGFGYKWASHRSYVDGANNWDVHESETCYNLFDGSYANSKYFNYENFVIIPSTQIADLEPEKSTGWLPASLDIDAMNKRAIEKLPIDKVTIKNLDVALRMVGIQLDVNIIDKVIDLVELIENKGDDVTIKDIISLQQTWSRHSEAFH